MMQRVYTGGDQTTSQNNYFKIYNAFFDVMKLTGVLIFVILSGRHDNGEAYE